MVVTTLEEIRPEIQELLAAACREARVPGATLAVFRGDELIELATGVVNLDTGVETTPDSLFQIGSISKVFTATLVMQLVDEGLVDLDAPVRAYVPEFDMADQGSADAVTVRRLLCHTSGIDGDVFDDHGRGDEVLSRYVASLKDNKPLFAPGELVSYCNSGFSVLGRLVECVRGLPSWDAALREYLVKPLGLSHTVSLPEEAVRFRIAVGHECSDDNGADDAPRVCTTWALPRSLGPAGASINSSARDLVTFARMHLRGGVAEDGTRLLSAESTAAMLAEQAVVPPYDGMPAEARGLGWALIGLPGGRTVCGHAGETIGQQALLRFFPDSGIGFALLTNSGRSIRVFQAIRERIYDLAGVESPPLPTPPQPPIAIDHHRFVGRYENGVEHYEFVRTEDGGIGYTVARRWAGVDSTTAEPETTALVGLTPIALVTAEESGGSHGVFGFPEAGADGRARYLYSGLRAAMRVD